MTGKTFFHWLGCWLGLHQPNTQTNEAEREAIIIEQVDSLSIL